MDLVKATKLNSPVSKKYVEQITAAVALQVAIYFLSALCMDCGYMKTTCSVATLGYWSGVALMIFRRPNAPTRGDLVMIRIGYLPAIVLALIFGWMASHLTAIP